MDYADYEHYRDAIAQRREVVQARITSACSRAGRNPDEVRLIAVSKTHPPDAVRAAAEAGLQLFGENRIQEARAKIPECPGQLTWHLIGHLQSNKIKYAVPLFDFIHSVDSLKLLEGIDQACAAAGKSMPVCLEVNVSGEAAKFGLTPSDVPQVLEASASWSHVEVLGLMTMPPYADDPERVRTFFRDLRELRDRCAADSGLALPELSMGMSHDFEIAIEEGATMVRVGTGLFGARQSRFIKTED